MNELLERQAVATKVVHWPTGLTYACDHHAGALQKIASAMGIHLFMDEHLESQRQCQAPGSLVCDKLLRSIPVGEVE
jgi:hypothetical protein